MISQVLDKLLDPDPHEIYAPYNHIIRSCVITFSKFRKGNW
jgi:hypothetical protein